MFWFMLPVDPIQSYLNLKIGLPLPVLKAGSSGQQENLIGTVEGRLVESGSPLGDRTDPTEVFNKTCIVGP
jgi:hypothetical protein